MTLQAIAVTLACCFSPAALGSEVWLVVAEEGAPPYHYTDPASGRVTGTDIDVVSAVLRNLGVAFQFKLVPWKRVKHLLRTGQADLAINFFAQPDDEHILIGPLRKTNTKLFCRSGCAIAYRDLSELYGYRTAGVAGYPYFSNPRFAALGLDKHAVRAETLVRMLIGNRVDLVLGDEQLLRAVAEQNGYDRAIEPLHGVLSVEPRYVAFKRRDYLKAARFRQSFELLEESGELEWVVKRRDSID